MRTALTIAGSDSSGGAGIQADLKTFTAHGFHGVCAVTAVTAQNTHGVSAIHPVPAEVVAAQIESVVGDIGVSAVKTGMLVNREIVETVARSLHALSLPFVVVDPVMVSSSGTRLLDEDAVATLINDLLPIASCVTPNREEAERLSGYPVRSDDDVRRAARRILALGPDAVVITGGHFDGETVVDVLFDGEAFVTFEAPRLQAPSTHGTGCTFSSALAALLAQGTALGDAVRGAKDYVSLAIQRGVDSGS
jgi:hydroxymethylpyrimidine/phosphomethylpyrimidine kinase